MDNSNYHNHDRQSLCVVATEYYVVGPSSLSYLRGLGSPLALESGDGTPREEFSRVFGSSVVGQCSSHPGAHQLTLTCQSFKH